MADKIYIDTNIFIDLMDSTRPFYKGSFDFVKNSITRGDSLYINSDTITNAFYILNRQRVQTELNLPLIMKKMITLFIVVPIENKEVMMALSLCEDTNVPYKDYEDALQYICAKKVESDLIVTNDKGFISIDIEVITSQ